MPNPPEAPGRAEFLRAFAERGPEEFISRGHPIGDLLEAYRWKVIAEGPGELSILAHLAPPLRNLEGQLFGGLTPTFLDLVGLFTVHAGEPKKEIGFPSWLTTVNLRMDYFEPPARRFASRARSRSVGVAKCVSHIRRRGWSIHRFQIGGTIAAKKQTKPLGMSGRGHDFGSGSPLSRNRVARSPISGSPMIE